MRPPTRHIPREDEEAAGNLILAVIVRLVRNCALGRTIQYAGKFRFNRRRHGALDTPPSRGMTLVAGMTINKETCDERAAENHR
jgi:hypothetical protein